MSLCKHTHTHTQSLFCTCVSAGLTSPQTPTVQAAHSGSSQVPTVGGLVEGSQERSLSFSSVLAVQDTCLCRTPFPQVTRHWEGGGKWHEMACPCSFTHGCCGGTSHLAPLAEGPLWTRLVGAAFGEHPWVFAALPVHQAPAQVVHAVRLPASAPAATRL